MFEEDEVVDDSLFLGELLGDGPLDGIGNGAERTRPGRGDGEPDIPGLWLTWRGGMVFLGIDIRFTKLSLFSLSSYKNTSHITHLVEIKMIGINVTTFRSNVTHEPITRK